MSLPTNYSVLTKSKGSSFQNYTFYITYLTKIHRDSHFFQYSVKKKRFAISILKEPYIKFQRLEKFKALG